MFFWFRTLLEDSMKLGSIWYRCEVNIYFSKQVLTLKKLCLSLAIDLIQIETDGSFSTRYIPILLDEEHMLCRKKFLVTYQKLYNKYSK